MGYSESIYTFANNIRTIEGGAHELGFKSSLTRLLNDFGRKTGLLKENQPNLSGDDAREGLTAVISVKLQEPPIRRTNQNQAG